MANVWHNYGEEQTVKILFGAVDQPSSYLLGLMLGDLAEAEDLVDIAGEPSGDGYARVAIYPSADFTFAIDGDYWRARAAQVTFIAAGGDWTAVDHWFITDGVGLFGSGDITSVTVLDGDTVDLTSVDLKVK